LKEENGKLRSQVSDLQGKVSDLQKKLQEQITENSKVNFGQRFYDFAEKNSKDPGSGENGGDLGFRIGLAYEGEVFGVEEPILLGRHAGIVGAPTIWFASRA
jgi:hypothetical protein